MGKIKLYLLVIIIFLFMSLASLGNTIAVAEKSISGFIIVSDRSNKTIKKWSRYNR